jgi:hypothetical protein
MKSIIWLILGLVIGLVIGISASYFYLNNIHPNNFPRGGNFQIDEKTKNEITYFFNNTNDINQIEDYCNQNRSYCFYYCRDINPNHEICNEIQTPMNRNR